MVVLRELSKESVLNIRSITMSAQVLKRSFWLSGQKLSIIPLKFGFNNKSEQVFKQIIIKSQIRYSWWLFFLFSYLTTFFELYYSLALFETQNLIGIMYHLFIIVSKTGAMVVVFTLQEKSMEICEFLNELYPKPNSGIFDIKSVFNKKHFDFYSVFLSTSTMGVCLFYVLFAPILAFIVPCLHENPLLKILISDCKSNMFRIVIYVTQLSFMLPVSAIASTGYCILLITLKELTKSTAEIW